MNEQTVIIFMRMTISPALCAIILHDESKLQDEDLSIIGIARMVKVATENIRKEKRRHSSIEETNQLRINKVVEAANILRRRIRIQELVDDGAWKPGIK